MVHLGLATVIVEDQPVGGAQKRIPVSSFPQDLHRECLSKDHVMPDYVYVQDTAVALGLQRVICGHKDGVGFGSLNLGHQFVVLGAETGSKDEHGSPQS